MSIFNLFGNTPKTSGPAVNPGINPAAVNPAAQNPASMQQPGEVQPPAQSPTSPATQQEPQAQASGLDKFKDFWDTPGSNSSAVEPLFNISQEQIMEAARKQQFTAQAATQEQMAAIAAGGQEAVKAMLEIVNAVGQNVYAQNAIATTKLIEGGFNKAGYAKVADVETRIKKHTLDNTLQDTNPLFSSPAAQPIIEGIKSQLLVKFPKASAKELNSMANEYLNEFTNAYQAPSKSAEQTAASKKVEDWSRFFGE